MIHYGAFVHSHAQVDRETVQIGAGTQIWQFASVIRNAHVGEDCVVGSCSIVDGAKISDRCRIGHGAQIHPGTRMGNDVFVGPGAIFCNDAWPSTDKEGWALAEVMEKPCIVVGDGASIGAGAIILPGVRIGEGAMIAAGAVVNSDVVAGSLLRRDHSVQMDFAKMPRQRMRFAR